MTSFEEMWNPDSGGEIGWLKDNAQDGGHFLWVMTERSGLHPSLPYTIRMTLDKLFHGSESVFHNF